MNLLVMMVVMMLFVMMVVMKIGKKNLEAGGEDDRGVLVAVVGEGGQAGVRGDRLEVTRNHWS